MKSSIPPLSHTHLLPQGTAKLSLNPGSSEVGLEQTGKRRQGWVTAIIHNQERKPTVWHWNRCWEDVSLSSQDLGSPSVTQTARDSQGQPGTVRDSQNPGRQWLRTETGLLTSAEPIRCPCSAATSLGDANCVRRVGCSALRGIHSGKFHTKSSGPGGVHILCPGYSSSLHVEQKKP